MNKPPVNPWRSAFFMLAALVAVSALSVDPPDDKEEAVSSGPGGTFVPVDGDLGTATGDGIVVGPEGDVAGGSGGTGTGPGGAASSKADKAVTQAQDGGAGLVCKAGQNGGNTDKGVSGNRIRLAATNVRSGTGASFLGTAYVGMQAVVNRVNAAGGVCGRLLDLRLVDDGWVAATGAGYLGTFAKEDYFALPVVPSSEGLTQAINSKIIANAQIPVVGSDGMLKEQYGDPWVWPVATSTVTTMRVMAKHAYDSGARTFGIVYDKYYRFGVEGATAFRQYLAGLAGSKEPRAFVGLEPGKGSYAGEAKAFNDACGSGCDFVAMLLTPETAGTYISSQTQGADGRKQGFGSKGTGGAQPLFNERFARDCAKHCDGMHVWTGYNPPIGRLASEKDVAAYVNDVKSVDPGVDVSNQFLQGAYLGMKVFVQALEKAGPKLTRAAVRDVMNTLTYTSDLASPLTWGPKVPEQRFANLSAQAFQINTASGSFVGFAETNTGFLRDPTPGIVPKD